MFGPPQKTICSNRSFKVLRVLNLHLLRIRSSSDRRRCLAGHADAPHGEATSVSISVVIAVFLSTKSETTFARICFHVAQSDGVVEDDMRTA
mmetsp:Transcript_8848/g.24006  ORF Transcript_8848/g.24006 Transcript_8848/m.24006 type:complete len:92 (-) Transcript_8848:251-526(-)